MCNATHHSLIIASAFSDACRHWSDMLQDVCAVCLVSDAEALQQVIANLKPSILVLQLSMQGLGRVQGLRRIQSLSPMTKTLVLVDTPTSTEGIAVLKTGAKGYYANDIGPLLLKKAVIALQNDELWIERKLVSALVAGLISITDVQDADHETKPACRLSSMTPRQREVADAIISGASNKEIATRLNLSERTVKAHLSELFRNFGVFDRLQLGLLLHKLPFGETPLTEHNRGTAQITNATTEDAFAASRPPVLRGMSARHTSRG